MLTDTLQPPSRSLARRFIAGAIAYSVAIFGVLKLGWVETYIVLPITVWQGRLAQAALGAPVLPLDVTLACSGADAIALCVGAIVAYPAPWPLRLGGSAAGLALILLLNSVRIGTLGRVADSPGLFETLHVYVWPAVLILVVAGYVFGWMQLVEARARAVVTPREISIPRIGTFAAWSVAAVVLFVASSSLYLQSSTLLIIAGMVARYAATALTAAGIHATVSGNILWTSRGGFEVTQECLSTPLIPLYFAAVMTYCRPWRWRVVALAAAVPLFFALGIARLLVVALPAVMIGSPLFLVHAFFQLLLAGVVVCGAAAWRRGAPAWSISVTACLAGAVCAYLLAPLYDRAFAVFAATPFNDAQGAMASMPPFQAGLFVALSIATMTAVAWRRVVAGLAALVAIQGAAFGALCAAAALTSLTPHVRDVRAWAIALPLAIVILAMRVDDQTRH